jgi:hypothetical protein
MVKGPYPRQSLGWVLRRLQQQWHIPDERIAAHLGLSPSALATLALCPVPPLASPGFDACLDRLAQTYGVPRWRLDFLCRAGLLDPPRLRD